ncbi:MAG TPA: DUF177 domain-containing protein, partial [Methylophilaceae bacterium]|nr:DUF177 domain-containing protein [Methylophilaceae bacterium]
TIALSQFPRLSDMLSSKQGVIDYVLEGKVSQEGESHLQLHIKGDLQLICQRCLGPLSYPLDAVADFILVSDESRIPAEETEADTEDYLVASKQMQVTELLEDELLLALPYAPKHSEEQCAEKTGLKVDTEKQSPFAVLKGLKSRDGE